MGMVSTVIASLSAEKIGLFFSVLIIFSECQFRQRKRTMGEMKDFERGGKSD